MRGWCLVLLSLACCGCHGAARCPCWPDSYVGKFRSRFFRAPIEIPRVVNTSGTLGPGGPQFSYGWDYLIHQRHHDPEA